MRYVLRSLALFAAVSWILLWINTQDPILERVPLERITKSDRSYPDKVISGNLQPTSPQDRTVETTSKKVTRVVRFSGLDTTHESSNQRIDTEAGTKVSNSETITKLKGQNMGGKSTRGVAEDTELAVLLSKQNRAITSDSADSRTVSNRVEVGETEILSLKKPSDRSQTHHSDGHGKQIRHLTIDACKKWCRRGDGAKPPYFLTAVLLVRIYSTDMAQLSTREAVQWIQYLRYAGVEHIYVYDAYVYKNESQQKALSTFIEKGYVTYVDWQKYAYPYSIAGTQVSAYQDCINKWGNMSQWQIAIDIDEYPFSPTDREQNFMQRFLREYVQNQPKFVLSEISMSNYLFLGKPLDDTDHPFLIDRIWRRTPKPSNNLVKPIYKPTSVVANVHHNFLLKGRCKVAPSEQLRMNHYWGARLQDWGEDTPEIIAKTIPDRSMEPIISEIKKCDWCLGKDVTLLYKKQWH